MTGENPSPLVRLALSHMGYSGTHGLEPFSRSAAIQYCLPRPRHDCAIFKLQTFEEARPWACSRSLVELRAES